MRRARANAFKLAEFAVANPMLCPTLAAIRCLCAHPSCASPRFKAPTLRRGRTGLSAALGNTTAAPDHSCFEN